MEIEQSVFFSRDFIVNLAYFKVRRNLLGWMWLIFHILLVLQLFMRGIPVMTDFSWETCVEKRSQFLSVFARFQALP